MSVTRLKTGFIGLAVIASVAVPLAIQLCASAGQREREGILARQAARLAELSAENERLSIRGVRAEIPPLSGAELAELLRLRAEIGRLRQMAGEINKLTAKNRRLQAARDSGDRQPPPPDREKVLAYWTKAQLAPVGYADPISALETTLCAMSRNDVGGLVGSVTPEAKSKMARERWNQHGPLEIELADATKRIADSLSPITGFYVVGRSNEKISPDGASLDVFFEGEGRTRKFALRKVGTGWKLDDLGDGLWP